MNITFLYFDAERSGAEHPRHFGPIAREDFEM